MPSSLLLRFCCGLWSRGDSGRSCQLDVEQEQQRFVVRERHPVGLPGVTQNLRGEPDVVGAWAMNPQSQVSVLSTISSQPRLGMGA